MTDQEEIVRAEHDVSHLSTCELGNSEVVKYFGKGMEVYFQFVFFLGAINSLLFLLSGLFIVIQWSNDSVVDWSYFAFFPEKYVFISLVCVVIAVSIFLWWYKLKTHVDEGQEIIGNDDIISSFCDFKQRLSHNELKILRFVLAACFVGLFFAYYYCQKALQAWAVKELSTTVGQTLMSFFFVFVDLIWRLSCSLLTSLESHKYLTSYQQSDCIKSFLSRIIMFSIWGAIVHLGGSTPITPDIGNGGNGRGNAEARLASALLNLLLINTLVAPFMDVLSTYLYNKCCFFFCCGGRSRLGDGEFKYKFNLADEYTQLLFRQYLINQCVLYVPMAPLIGVLGCLLEWWTDKYKLVKLCKVAERHALKFTKIVVCFLFVDLLAMFFSYPGGIFW